MNLPTPNEIASVPVDEIPVVMSQLASLQALLAARLLETSRGVDEPSRLLSVEEAAEKLATTPDWLYRHAHEFPFTRPISPRQLRFDLRGLERYLSDGRKDA